MLGRALAKTVVSALFLGTAGCLVWYGVVTNRIAAKDWEFQVKHPSAMLFPEVLLLKGNLAYYTELDARSASQYFIRAIAKDPTMIAAWLGLVKAKLMLGEDDEARRIADTITPFISHVSTWKWQELLLAYETHDERTFASSFNFILNRLPPRIPDAGYLALSFWGSWEAILPHITPEAHLAFLNVLMGAAQIDVALNLWEEMERDVSPPNKEVRLRFSQFLLQHRRIGPAIQVWRTWREGDHLAFFDGGFETEPLNTAFGWIVRPHPEVTIERSLESPYAGVSSLYLHFRGTANLSFSNVSQVVPVLPGKWITVKFAHRSRNVTTDQGIYLDVTDMQTGARLARSNAVLGSSPWTRDEVSLLVPESCQAIQVTLRRNESLKFDSKIAGDYWIDALELELEPALE